MNEVNITNPRGMKAQQTTRMSTSSLQLKHVMLMGACSLVLGASTALCSLDRSPAVSHAQGSLPAIAPHSGYGASEHLPRHPQSPVSEQQSQLIQPQTRNVKDFSPIARPATPTGVIATQPSVYHSIIDRTDGPARRASPAIQTSLATTAGDLHTAAGHHHRHAHGKYYEYRAVPKKKTWKFGYKRGNHKHTISRHEHGKAGKHPHFKTKVKWHDKKSKGKGIHLWDYNHHDKKHYHHG